MDYDDLKATQLNTKQNSIKMIVFGYAKDIAPNNPTQLHINHFKRYTKAGREQHRAPSVKSQRYVSLRHHHLIFIEKGRQLAQSRVLLCQKASHFTATAVVTL